MEKPTGSWKNRRACFSNYDLRIKSGWEEIQRILESVFKWSLHLWTCKYRHSGIIKKTRSISGKIRHLVLKICLIWLFAKYSTWRLCSWLNTFLSNHDGTDLKSSVHQFLSHQAVFCLVSQFCMQNTLKKITHASSTSEYNKLKCTLSSEFAYFKTHFYFSWKRQSMQIIS